jgi:hypothetical protein
MSGPTQLVITLTGGAGTVTISIPAALQSLDSTTPGASQTGFSSTDQLVRAIFRANGFFDGVGTWYPLYQVQKITSQ